MPQLTRCTAWPWPHDQLAVFVDMPWTPFTRTWWPGPSFIAWTPVADWTAWGTASFQAWNSLFNQASHLAPMAPRRAFGPAPDYGYASYRSAGGHAAAQIATPATELAGLTATAMLTPMQTLLGVWRAALET
jgi:hypothetical protein